MINLESTKDLNPKEAADGRILFTLNASFCTW